MAKQRQWWLVFMALIGLLLISRLYGLSRLPVFADEAIYIRWAQMIADDPREHLFLPLYDGKTPLFMWVMIPFLRINVADPVWSARLLSVLVGTASLLTLSLIIRQLGGGKIAMGIGALLYLLLPFTFFHDRMALTDGLLLLFMSLTFLGLLKLKRERSFRWMVLTGLFYGASLLTKLPGLIFLIEFLLVLWLMPPSLSVKDQRKAALMFGGAAVIGLGMLYSLRISELFPFLFQRGSDFTFTIQGLVNGEWRFSLINMGRFVRWQMWYATPFIWLLVLLPWLWSVTKKVSINRTVLTLVFMGLAYAVYFVIFGKIIFSRYFLPMVIWLIPAGALTAEWLWNTKRKLLVLGFLALTAMHALWFMWPLWTDVTQAHFETEDTGQYLTSWSAGFGNKEVAQFLQSTARVHAVTAATEGFFGTLPDGLSIYFNRSPLNDKVDIYGIGQPISGLPDDLRAQAMVKPTYLIANEHRLVFDFTTCCDLLEKFPRPYEGPALLLLKVRR